MAGKPHQGLQPFIGRDMKKKLLSVAVISAISGILGMPGLLWAQDKEVQLTEFSLIEDRLPDGSHIHSLKSISITEEDTTVFMSCVRGNEYFAIELGQHPEGDKPAQAKIIYSTGTKDGFIILDAGIKHQILMTSTDQVGQEKFATFKNALKQRPLVLLRVAIDESHFDYMIVTKQGHLHDMIDKFEIACKRERF